MPHTASELDFIQTVLDYRFTDVSLLELALTHESYSNEQDLETGNNERLEFLGDSILGAAVCLYLYKHQPRAQEGRLAQVKSYVVSTYYLAEKAKTFNLGDFLAMGKGESQSAGGHKASLLADTFEAVIGAIYLDGGFEPAKKFIYRFLTEAMDNMEGSQKDYKSMLQEYTQRNLKLLPVYTVAGESGPAHDLTFKMLVHLDGEEMGVGVGHSKQEAGQHAAAEALNLLRERAGFDLEMSYEINLPKEKASEDKDLQEETLQNALSPGSLPPFMIQPNIPEA